MRRSSAPELPPGALEVWSDAELGVTAVTEGAVAGGAAVAGIHSFRRVKLENVGGFAAALMTAIAELAVLTQATGAKGMGAGRQFEGSGIGGVAHLVETPVQASERLGDRASAVR